MSSRAGSTFVTFLMSIPVAAAGLVAFFGVPPLSSVIAASRSLSDKAHDFGEVDQESSHSSGNKFEEWGADPAPEWAEDGSDLGKKGTDLAKSALAKSHEFAREVDDLGFSKLPREGQDNTPPRSGQGRPQTRRDQFASLGSSDKSDSELLPSDASRSGRSEFNGGSTARPMTMKESLKKLNSLGVKHYHLERGADQDSWLFVCLFSPGDDTRVTHRFEAESDDPDGAVAETLKQIDGWLLKRFKDKQPISQSAM